MSTTATVVLATATAVLKKVFDDVYDIGKRSGKAYLTKNRADIKDNAIAKAIHSITKVKTIWNIEKEVSLYNFYYPSSIEFSDEICKRVNSIKELNGSGNCIVQGTAGQGKSIFLRYLCGQELNQRLSSGRLPLFIELRRISPDSSLNDLIIQALQRFKLPATLEAWHALASSGKTSLLLDAFDEIDPAISGRTICEIETLAESYRDQLQIIITSRPDADIQKSTLFRVFKLAPLTTEDHLPFLKKICSDSEQSGNIIKVLKESPTEVTNLLTTPLMMTLLVILYKSAQTIPDTVPKFYEELFDVLFYRHDHSKPGFRRKRFTSLDDGSLKRIFSAFCFFFRLENIGTITTKKFSELCDAACESSGMSIDPNALRNELVKTICLMQEEGFELSFIHKSVAQYYAASFIAKSSDDFASSFYEIAKSHRSWDLELRFLSEIDKFRYSTHFEIPILHEFGNDIGIKFENTRSSDRNKLKKYLTNNVSLVIETPADNDRQEFDGDSIFLGWSSPLSEKDIIRRDALFPWIIRLMLHIERKIIDSGESPKTGPGTTLIPITRFEKHTIDLIDELTERTLVDLRLRYTRANDIIHTEARKKAILDKFRKESKR